TDDDGGSLSAQASESVDVADVPATIAVTKAADVASVPEPGGPVTYTVTVQNTSAVDVVTIGAVTDSVDGGAPFAAGGDCPDLVGDELAPGASASCSFTLAVTGGPGTTVADTVTVTGADDDGGDVSAQGSASVAITDVLPSLTVTKTASPSSVPETGPGETRTVTYTVGIQNDAAEPLSLLGIVDAVDGGPAAPVAGTCDDLVGTTLAAQAGTTCEFTMEVAGDAGDTTTDVVTVSAADDEQNQVSASDDATVTFTDQASSLLVDKAADVSSVPEPGGPVTYTVTVTNSSPVDAVTIDSVTDSVGGGAPFAAGGDCPALVGTALAPGAGDSCSFTLDVTGDAGDVVADTVTVAGTDEDGAPVSATGDESVAITDVASSLAVTKVANVASVPEPGGPVTYAVTVTNTSAVDAVTIDSVTDSVDGGAPFAAGGDCPDLVGDVLEPGGSASCSFTLDVAGEPGDVVADTVTVAGTDSDGGDVSAEGSETVDIADVATTLLVTKTPDVSSVPEPGAPVTFTVGITNQSTVDIVTISSITDAVSGGAEFPAGGTCPGLVGSELAPGASTSCSFTLDVAGNAGDVVTDTVTVVGDDGDPEPVPGAPTEAAAKSGGLGGEQDPAPEPEPEPEPPVDGPARTVSGQGSASVSIAGVAPTGTVDKVATPNVVSEFGGPVSYGITVTNTSPQEAVTLTSLTDAVGGATLDATTVSGPITATTCATGGVIAPGGTYSCAFTYAIPAGKPGDTVVDTVTAVLVDDDGDSVSPSDTETVSLANVAPAITVDKDNGDAVLPAPGGDVDFTVTVGNPSAEAVTITSITDSVDGGPPASVTGCAPGSVIVPGGSFSCTFRMAVTSDEAATIVDEVVVQAVDDDGSTAQASDTAVTRITASADVSITKRLAGPELVPGTDGAYELVVANAGPSKAVDVQVVDALPEGLTALAATGPGWTCNVAPRTVTCQRAELAAGESSTITISVSVSADVAGRSITNVADVTSTTDDPDLDNNHAELTTDVGAVGPNEENPPPGPSGPGEPPAVGPADLGNGGSLPRTGGDSGPLVRDGLLLVGLGAVLVALRRFLTRRPA
ncbi:MAG: DUF11 domain-containing protein, partial [Actinobacteria bacterium]|nr:DUF11 domain-containing protein [Actinomycetota bacterium]